MYFLLILFLSFKLFFAHVIKSFSLEHFFHIYFNHLYLIVNYVKYCDCFYFIYFLSISLHHCICILFVFSSIFSNFSSLYAILQKFLSNFVNLLMILSNMFHYNFLLCYSLFLLYIIFVCFTCFSFISLIVDKNTSHVYFLYFFST